MPTSDQIVIQLRKWDDAYYNGHAIVDDATYDKLRDHLKSIDPDNDYFKVVGAPTPSHREEVDLIIHMGSQLKINTVEEARGWFDKYNQELIVSDKLDGSSMEVVYRGGKLWRVSTRGDGQRGMAVTKNGKLWSGLPHTIDVKGECVIRGEVQMSTTAYNKHFSDMANPRNAGNGIAVSDSDYERNEHLTFHAFDIIHPTVEFKKQSHKFKALDALGVNTVRWFRCRTWDDLMKCRTHYEKDRPDLDFEIDGMILALEDLAAQKAAGFADGGTRPKAQVAWKFPAETAITKVTGMVLTLGHTGKVIPKATLDPVKLAGTTVSNVLLNNFDYIAEKDINIGDEVLVLKGGDIIPWVERVVTKHTAGPYPAPTHWRAKDGKDYPLIKEGSDWKVEDEDCPDLNFQRIRNWINKTNIKQLGDTALLAMVESGMVSDIDDLYDLDEDEVAELPVGNGKIGSNAKKILTEIDKTREMTIDLFIGSLSIKHLGRSRAALLIEHGFDDVKPYLDMNPNSLAGLPCSETGKYGSDVAEEIYRSFQGRRDLVSQLAGCIEILQPKKKATNGRLSGISFCFSGVRMKPDQKDLLRDLGGSEKNGVSGDLTYLVLKDASSSSSKAEKARKLGVKIIDMDEFQSMLDN